MGDSDKKVDSSYLSETLVYHARELLSMQVNDIVKARRKKLLSV